MKGWKYTASFLLEAADVVLPIFRSCMARVSAAVSWLLVKLIGRALGLIYRGVKQSLVPQQARNTRQPRQKTETDERQSWGVPKFTWGYLWADPIKELSVVWCSETCITAKVMYQPCSVWQCNVSAKIASSTLGEFVLDLSESCFPDTRRNYLQHFLEHCSWYVCAGCTKLLCLHHFADVVMFASALVLAYSYIETWILTNNKYNEMSSIMIESLLSVH